MVGRMIKRALVAGLAGLAFAGAVAAHEGEDGPRRGWDRHGSRLSPEDRAAFADARPATRADAAVIPRLDPRGSGRHTRATAA